jgi:ubiquitin C-terminal hydrolase
VLQTLFNLPHFSDYFEKSEYTRHLHPKNKGIAKVFGNLVAQMKASGSSSSAASSYSLSSYSYGSSNSTYSRSGAGYETPQEFKSSFSRACSKFSGYSQEDAQEFLVALLELLSSDLNRQKDPAKYKELGFDKKMSIEANV